MNLVENESNTEEEKSISASIDESSTDNDSDEISIITNAFEDIRDRSKINPELNASDAILKIRDLILKTQNEWKVSELSSKSMGKGTHKLFMAVVN